jgi:hypothetical protein
MIEILVIAVAANANIDLQKLERYYWDCDYTGATTMLSFNDAIICGEIFERFKKEKFNGNWQDFYIYWKENKEKEYNKRGLKNE